MSLWPDGLYDVTADDDAAFKGTKYFASRELIAKPPLLIVEWAIPERISEDKHTLEFDSRSVYWKYQISGAEGVTDLSIETSDASFTGNDKCLPKPSFTGKLAQGEIIESDDKVKLTQAPWTGIMLKQEETELIVNLPNPNVSQVYRFQKDETIGGTSVKKDDFYALIQVESSK